MQINKTKGSRKSWRQGRDDYAKKRAEASRGASRSYRADPQTSYKSGKDGKSTEEDKKNLSKEDAIIDLYDDPFKEVRDEDKQLIIDIDFSKPIEVLGEIYRQLKDLARVVQSKATKENAQKVRDFVTRDKKTMAMTAVAAVVVLGVFGRVVFNNDGSGGQGSVQGEATEQSIVLDSSTEFEILIPSYRQKDQLAIAKINPPNTPDAYAYPDIINDNEVQVTQQELPDRFKTNQIDEFKSFAEGFAANQDISGDDFMAYVGKSVDGPQSVVAIKNDRLILIKSKKEIEIELWRQYIASLK